MLIVHTIIITIEDGKTKKYRGLLFGIETTEGRLIFTDN